MLNKILVLFTCLFSFTAFSQNEPIAEAHKLNDDLTHLKEVLFTSHPGTFEYISKDSLNYFFDSLRFDNSEIATKLELEKKVRFILSKIGCIHTSIKSTIFKDNKTFIPFKLYACGNDLWIEKDYADSLSINKAYRVLAINGNSVNTIFSKMKEFRPSDGYNTTFKYGLMNQDTWFNWVYQYYFDSDTIRTYTIINRDFDTTIIKRKNISKIPEIKRLSTKEYGNYGKNISVEFDSTNSIAILKIKSFSGSPILGTSINKNRYKKALKLIEQEGYSDLVIDLRNNTGGDAASGYSLLSFFTQENHSVVIKKHKGKIFKYAAPSSKVAAVVNFFFGHLFASRIPTFKARESIVKVKKSKNYCFKGDVFIIANGFTLSTASNVTSLFKNKTNAIIVGQETGGSENNLNAYFFPIIKLPYSKIKIQIPQHKINLNLVENKGSGIIPHIPITYSIDDRISTDDLEIRKIIKMVSAK